MNNINAPPTRKLKSSVGIDSIFLQFKEVYKSDVDLFCEELGLSYKGNKRGKYTRKWTIFLEGGQPITVVYHFKSKTTTFQIGKLMNYSRSLNDQHEFLQRIMSHYSDKKMQVSGLHFAVDVKEPIGSLLLKSNLKLKSENPVGSTIYFNRPNGTVLTMYDKGTQMKIYSTSLTRFELRLAIQLGQWKVKDFAENRQSFENLASKVEKDFDETIEIYSMMGRTHFKLNTEDVKKVLENFIAFLHGGCLPEVRDHFKVYQALQARDHFLTWMTNNRIKSAKEINSFVKGKKAVCQKALGIDHKTFNKAVQFYKGIPNFKIAA